MWPILSLISYFELDLNGTQFTDSPFAGADGFALRRSRRGCGPRFMNSAPATPLKGPAVGGAEMSFFEALEARAKQANSLLCVGLDPHTTELSEPSAEAAEAFCLKLIKATSDVAAAYKPNAAFFEVFGAPGAAALGRVIAAIQKVG